MISKETKLTPHFTLGEMTASKSHPEINNIPPLEVVDNLRKVCEWLEDLRRLYNNAYEDGKDTPLYVNSGYRSPLLNRAIGGALHSNHLDGCAADIRCSGKDANERATKALRYACLLLEVASLRKERFDELIIERKGTSWWVHFAVTPKSNGMYITCLNKS